MLTKLRVFGDCHGHNELLAANLDPEAFNFCLGDMQLYRADDWKKLPMSLNFGFCRGNHDNLEVCRQHPRFFREGKVFYAGANLVWTWGGAHSIDWHKRTEGVDWFPDEEFDETEEALQLEIYKTLKPAIVLSHDGPQSVTHLVCNGDVRYISRTQKFLQRCYTYHQPKFWVFGHWHRPFDQTLGGTRFVCLDTMAVLEITNGV